MEALVAVGLAGNVVQFVQFSGQLISETIAIRRNGTPSSLPNLRNLSDNLTKQAGVIKARLKASNATLAQEDQYLLDVATECEQTGARFTAYLDNLMKQLASPNPLRSATKTIQRLWSQHKIEDFVSLLEKLRSTLTLATILAFRSSVSGNNEEILAHLRAIEVDDKAQDINKGEIMENIQLLVDIVQGQAGTKLDKIQEHIRNCMNEINFLRREIPTTREGQILEWLNFRQMTWRYEEIDPAYRKTFEWIFQEPPGENGWNDFVAHLSKSDVSEPYFINGKAGSGKSTLMKFIVNHHNTNKALQHWAGEQELLVLNFFFWNLGTALQKTNVGMLRALLHRVLERYPELIPAAFPKMYHAWRDSDANSAPDYIEVKRAFSLMIEKAKFLRLCIFIDGIDEFEGDHRDMSRFLRSLTCPQIKLIVSSRPINPCLNALHGCPGLRLQDLTRADMELFVQGELTAHHLMMGMAQRFPQETHELRAEIQDKAEGVFLWVKLVVNLLIDGLEAGDDMKDLQNKLHSLPSNLRDLYRRMIEKMQPEYQIQAAEMFQLFHTWNTVMAEQPLRALVLSYGTHNPSEAFGLAVSPLDSETFNWLAYQIEARIRSRCCGLLELHEEKQGWGSRSEAKFYMSIAEIAGPVVSYLHRTVAEFLMSGDVWNEIRAMTKESQFDPIPNLASACLSTVKVARDLFDPTLLLHVAYTSTICRRATAMPDRLVGQYIACLDETMKEHSKRSRTRNSNCSTTTADVHWSAEFFPEVTNSRWQEKLYGLASNLTFAARNGLIQYLKAYSVGSGFPSRYAMVVYAVESWRDAALQTQPPVTEQAPSLQERVETLSYLLRNVAKPEDSLLDITLWHYAVLVGEQLLNAGKQVSAAELLRTFLCNAKSPKELMNHQIRESVWIINPRRVVQELASTADPATRGLSDELKHLMSSDLPVLNASRVAVHSAVEPASGDEMFRRRALNKAKHPNAPIAGMVHIPSVADSEYHDLTHDAAASKEQWTWEDISSQLGGANLPRPTLPDREWQRFSGFVLPSQSVSSYQTFNNILPPIQSHGYGPFGAYGWPNLNVEFHPPPHFPIPQCQPQIPTRHFQRTNAIPPGHSWRNNNRPKNPRRFRKTRMREKRAAPQDHVSDKTSSLPG